MRKLFTLLAALALTTFVAAPAGAAVIPVCGTLTVAIGTLGGISLTGTGLSNTTGGIGGTHTLGVKIMTLNPTATVVISPVALNLSLITVPANITTPAQNFAGTFVAGHGALGNNAIANLFFTNGAPAGSVPLNYVGGGGVGMAVVAGLSVTITGATWTDLGLNATTPSKQTVIMAVAAGIPMTATVTAFDNRTVAGLGTVQMIAPANANIAMGSLGSLPVIGVLTLQYKATPEPGILLVLAASLAGLVAVARQRAGS